MDDLEKQEKRLSDDSTELAQQRTLLAEERSRLARERTEFAESRTGWAERRTLLANERTFSAWLRTGLSAMAGGLAVTELLTGDEVGLIGRVIGTILILVGGGVIGLALWRYNQVSESLAEEGLPITPPWVAAALVGGLLLTAVLVLILISLG